ncbi:MAG: MurR/RpiR family transcriptional regulator [Lentisphaeria bacterium]|nr:MurR/RpiR family transcriptional regulator [Lentisphaeria bacterium]
MTESTPKTLLKIRNLYSSFHGNYIRIADCILHNPGLLIRDKVSDVAAACNCDNAQIIRFCQKLGFKGFSDMKRAISHDLIPLQTQVDTASVNKGSGFGRLLEDFRKDYLQTINDTIAMCDEKIIQQIVEKIKKARKIMLCGLGASGIVCEDLQMKLVHMGYPAFYHSKPTMNKMMSSLMEKNDLMIVVSFRGENTEILNYIQVAKNNGCPVAAICNYSQSPVAESADMVLLTSANEDDFRIGAMTSRLSQLMVVDILSVMLALNDIKKTERNLAKTHTVLKENKEVKP